MSLITTKQNQTMSSREIAELTRKDHKNVMADIRNMFAALDLSTAEFSAVYKADNGQSYEMFNLPKDLTLTLISGYDIALRYRVVKKLEEYELGYMKPQMDALEFAEYHLEQMREKERMRIDLLEVAPKLRVLQDLTEAPGGYLLNDAAKVLEIQPKYFRNMLVKQFNWLFKTPKKKFAAYETAIHSGYMCHRIAGGQSAPMITAKGMVRIRSLLDAQIVLALEKLAL